MGAQGSELNCGLAGADCVLPVGQVGTG